MMRVARRLFGAEPLLVQKSIIPTTHFQNSMAELPIPPVDATLDRYVAAVTPLLTPEELENTTKIVADFRARDAKEADKYLRREASIKRRDDVYSSYISDDWFDLYLTDRSPLAVNLNPFVVWKDKPNCSDPITRSALIVKSSVDFFLALQGGYLKPQVWHTKPVTQGAAWQRFASVLPKKISAYGAYAFGAYPLDMSQFPQLFHTTRIPQIGKDKTKTSYDRPGHIVVMYRGNMYQVTVMENRQPVSPSQVAARLRQIVASNPAPNPQPLGIFTAGADRDSWATTRSRLEQTRANRDAFRAVDSAMFVLSLEEDSVYIGDRKDSELTEASRFFLHGGAENRWFDKSFNIVMGANATAAVNFEHAWGDGVAVLRYMEDVHIDSNNADANQVQGDENATESIKPITFNLDGTTDQELKRETDKFNDFITNGLNLSCKLYRPGKQYLNSIGVRPDGLFQVAFQLAYYKLHGQFESAYESASTSGFRCGRTEAIRGTTIEAKNFCLTFSDPNATAQEKIAAMQAAMKKHHAITVEALKGLGVDRHLFAMKKSLERMQKMFFKEDDIHEFYNDVAYKKLGANMISTSTLASERVTGGGFGPVSPGYGVGYGGNDDTLMLHVTSFKRSPDEFIQACHESFNQIIELVKQSKN